MLFKLCNFTFEQQYFKQLCKLQCLKRDILNNLDFMLTPVSSHNVVFKKNDIDGIEQDYETWFLSDPEDPLMSQSSLLYPFASSHVHINSSALES